MQWGPVRHVHPPAACPRLWRVLASGTDLPGTASCPCFCGHGPASVGSSRGMSKWLSPSTAPPRPSDAGGSRCHCELWSWKWQREQGKIKHRQGTFPPNGLNGGLSHLYLGASNNGYSLCAVSLHRSDGPVTPTRALMFCKDIS